MKYKVTRTELNECIAEAVAKVIKENVGWDEIDAILNNAEKDKRAAKAAQKDVDKEISSFDDDEEIMDVPEVDDEEDDRNTEFENMSYEELIDVFNNPKNGRQKRFANSELRKRNDIKKEAEEEGTNKFYGYFIDQNGNVQPSHTTVGSAADPNIYTASGADFSGLGKWGGGKNQED